MFEVGWWESLRNLFLNDFKGDGLSQKLFVGGGY